VEAPVNPPTLQSARSSARRWRFASGFLFFGALTVVAGYYLPLRRETVRLRADSAQLRRELDQTQRELATELTRPREAAPARPPAATPASLSLTPGVASAAPPGSSERTAHEDKQRAVKQRIERLEKRLDQRFGELSRAQQLSLSSAGDRVSVAVASSRLFTANSVDVGAQGRSLLCELSEQITSDYQGQLRVTGYYGKPRIAEPVLQRRYRTPWERSAARAARAVDVLVRDCKAPAERFLAVGYGPRAAGPLGENVAFEFIVGESD
jgi:flagellar motor protein MotB